MSSNKNDVVAVRISKVVVNGNKRCRNDYFYAELLDVINKSLKLPDFSREVQLSENRMRNSGIFESVKAEIQVEKVENNEAEAIMNLNVVERKIPSIKLESFVQGGGNRASGVGGEIQGSLRSPFGYGEMINLKSGSSTSGSGESALDISIPHIGKPRLKGLVKLSSSSEDTSVFNGISMRVQSLICELTSRNSRHRLVFEGALRDEVPVGPMDSIAASPGTMLSFGPSSKFSVKYSFDLDSRDCGPNPTKGQYMSGQVEQCLPIGSSLFTKLDFQAQSHHDLFKLWNKNSTSSIILSLCGQLGVLLPWGKDRPSMIDNYHIGGPLSLRGFVPYGGGPRSYKEDMLKSKDYTGNAMGGTKKASVLALLSFPFPSNWYPETNRTFLFFNMAALGEGPLSTGFASPRASIGAGLSFSMSNAARIEMTYSIPVLRSSHDAVKPFQLGVAMNLV